MNRIAALAGAQGHGTMTRGVTYAGSRRVAAHCGPLPENKPLAVMPAANLGGRRCSLSYIKATVSLCASGSFRTIGF